MAHGNGVLFPEKLLFLNMDLHPQFESQPRDSILNITGIHLDLSLELSITIPSIPMIFPCLTLRSPIGFLGTPMFGVRLEKVSTGMRRLRAVTEKLEARHGELEDFPNEPWSNGKIRENPQTEGFVHDFEWESHLYIEAFNVKTSRFH